jgi:hypothetical protein
MELFILQLSPTSCYFFFGPNIILRLFFTSQSLAMRTRPGKPMCRWENNIICPRVQRLGLNSPGSVQGSVLGFCDDGTESSSLIETGICLSSTILLKFCNWQQLYFLHSLLISFHGN